MPTPGHYSRVRASDSAWVANGAVYYHEFQQIDRNLADCLHEGGGTFSLASTLAFGGTYGISFAAGTPLNSLGPVYFDGSLSVGSLLTADIVAAFGARTTARFYGPITASGVNSFTSGFTAGTSTFTDDLTIGAAGKTCTVNGLLDAKGNVNLGDTTGDTVSIKGTTQFEGPATSKNMHLGTTAGTAGDLTTLDNDFTLGTGRIVANTEFLPDSDNSFTYRYRFYFALTTATRYLDVSIPNPRKGTEYHVHGDVNVAYNVMIRTNGGTTGSIGPGSSKNCLVMYDGTTWRFINY